MGPVEHKTKHKKTKKDLVKTCLKNCPRINRQTEFRRTCRVQLDIQSPDRQIDRQKRGSAQTGPERQGPDRLKVQNDMVQTDRWGPGI